MGRDDTGRRIAAKAWTQFYNQRPADFAPVLECQYVESMLAASSENILDTINGTRLIGVIILALLHRRLQRLRQDLATGKPALDQYWASGTFLYGVHLRPQAGLLSRWCDLSL